MTYKELDAPLGKAVQAVAHAVDGRVVARYLCLLDLMDEDGGQQFEMYTSAGLRPSDSYGMLRLAEELVTNIVKKRS